MSTSVKVGDLVFVTDLKKKEIIQTRIYEVIASDGGEILYRGRYAFAPFFFPLSAMDLTLHDALVNFRINLINYSEHIVGFK